MIMLSALLLALILQAKNHTCIKLVPQKQYQMRAGLPPYKQDHIAELGYG